MTNIASVPFVNLGIQYQTHREEILKKIDEISLKGQYILSEEVTQFEENFAKYCGTKHALGVAHGTDALFLVLKAWGIGPGDEVITAPNSFIASAGAIAQTGATIAFTDIDETFNLDPKILEKSITSHTKAIIPVHFTGMPAEMREINALAKKHNLKVLEDSAQAVGAQYSNKMTGNLADAGAFSLHPLKNFHLHGDAGIITTNDTDLYHKLMLLRNHGLKNRDECVEFAINSRLDAYQAGIGNIKFKYINEYTYRFQEIAKKYTTGLTKINKFIKLPIQPKGSKGVFHNYMIRTQQRDKLKDFLQNKKGIQTAIHYPIPIHLQKACEYLGYKKGDFPITEAFSKNILSLPIYPELTDIQVNYVIESLIEFCEK